MRSRSLTDRDPSAARTMTYLERLENLRPLFREAQRLMRAEADVEQLKKDLAAAAARADCMEGARLEAIRIAQQTHQERNLVAADAQAAAATAAATEAGLRVALSDAQVAAAAAAEREAAAAAAQAAAAATAAATEAGLRVALGDAQRKRIRAAAKGQAAVERAERGEAAAAVRADAALREWPGLARIQAMVEVVPPALDASIAALVGPGVDGVGLAEVRRECSASYGLQHASHLHSDRLALGRTLRRRWAASGQGRHSTRQVTSGEVASLARLERRHSRPSPLAPRCSTPPRARSSQ